MRNIAVTILVLTACRLQAADGDTCQPISSAPTTITTSGVYCMTADISYTSASGTAIMVNAGHVVIDLSGYTLTNLAAGTGTGAFGIYSSAANTTVRNGTVLGFLYGISTYGSGALVEDIRGDQNQFEAIQVGGLGSVVRNNLVIHTAGSFYGIYVSADGSRILNNDVVDAPNGIAASGKGIIVEGNRVTSSATPSTVNPSYGINVGSTGLAVNNRIVNMTYGVYMAAGVAYRDNLTIGALTAYSGGNNAGNNQSF